MRCRCCTAIRGLAGAAAASRLEKRALKCMCFSMLRALSLRFLLSRLGGDPCGSCCSLGRGRAARGLLSRDLQAMSGSMESVQFPLSIWAKDTAEAAFWLPEKGGASQRAPSPRTCRRPQTVWKSACSLIPGLKSRAIAAASVAAGERGVLLNADPPETCRQRQAH